MNFYSKKNDFIRRSLTLVFFLTVICPLFGISFQGLDVSNDDRLLFKADFQNQQALYLSYLNDLSLKQLTAFPEKLEVGDGGKTLIASNSFGAVKINVSGGLPSVLPGYPSFLNKKIPLKGKLQNFSLSADSRWLLYVEPVSAAYGNLILVDTLGGNIRIACENIELPSGNFPALWSPDSALFIYEKAGNLYYFPVIQTNTPYSDERFRMLGQGGISSVIWGQQRDFYYLHINTLYRVSSPELFTRTIYGDFLSIGTVAGILPENFNPQTDRYWLAPDGTSVIVSNDLKSFYFYPLGDIQGGNSVLPYVMLPQGCLGLNVMWDSAGHVTVAAALMQKSPAFWRFEVSGKTIKQLTSGENPLSANGLLSPDKTKAAFWGEAGLELWDFVNWRLIQNLSKDRIFSCAWIDNDELAAGNIRFIEAINVVSRTFQRRMICLSTADEFGFEDLNEQARILIKSGNDWYAGNGIDSWVPIRLPRLRKLSITSERYRVYLETQSSGPFINIPMVRNFNSTATVSLVSGHSYSGAYRHEKQSIALCFDLYDDDTGLYQILDALGKNNIKATFFINGDFIRRNPAASAVVFEAGHEIASLFYAPIDLSNSRYRVNREYITQGIARNEDEYFRVTGKELYSLWHPPFYRNSEFISSAAAESGYHTVTRDVDCGDWLPRDEALRLGIKQNTASDMINIIIERKKHGAVIPLRIGLLPGGRDDYLFHRFDVLLNALLRSGCEIVPVSAVIRK
jgi:peptidoglycan/xylan/chitin deacetylase (PgdA/CDA1 family)